ncbi:MAG: VOC family protein [Defluviitaleaceae bacterium]|nr:VOC family protein [Defluviitaleaceae bacterium]
MITPCIHFQDNCDEAIKFYKETLGAEVKEINYTKDAPAGSGMDELPPNFVMHSEVIIYGMTFSFTDGSEATKADENTSFIITLDTAEEVTAVFKKLEVGGKIIEPLAEVFWSPLYCYVRDKFGVNWQVMVRQ